jgi:hypothetical protein
VNFLDDEAPAAIALRRARDEGWLRLQYTDTLAIELSDAPAEKRQALLGLAADYAVTLGPVVNEHSRVDTSVGASEQDFTEYEQVLSLLHPNIDRTTASQNHFRDAKHVHTAVRYRVAGFITRDKRLLSKDAAFREQFRGFEIVTPERALERVDREARSCVRLKEATGRTNWPGRSSPSAARTAPCPSAGPCRRRRSPGSSPTGARGCVREYVDDAEAWRGR